MILKTTRTPLLDDDHAAIMEQLAAERTSGPSEFTKTLVQNWFGGLRLAESYNTAWPTKTRMLSVVLPDRGVCPIDDARDLHGLRMRFRLNPVGEDAVNWLRVFAYIARGAEGPFVLAEDPDQLARACGIKRDGISPGLRANLRPPQVVFIDGAQTFVHARILYADKLFETAFRVGRPDPDCGDLWAGGEVEMIHDEPIGPAGVRCEMTLASVRMSRFEV